MIDYIGPLHASGHRWRAESYEAAGAAAEQMTGGMAERFTRAALAALRRPIIRPYVIVLGAVSIEVCEVVDGRPSRCIAVIYFRGATMPQMGMVRQ